MTERNRSMNFLKTKVGRVAFILISMCLVVGFPVNAEEKEIKTPPFTVVVRTIGAPIGKYSWEISMNSSGEVSLHVFSPTLSVKRYSLMRREIDKIHSMLVESSFFELNASYGKKIPEGILRDITVIQNDKNHRVEINYLDEVNDDRVKTVLKIIEAFRKSFVNELAIE
jgi:hypothetical protein